MVDPALNLLHNTAVMAVLDEARSKLEAMGVKVALIPGGPRPREDQALPLQLLIAPNDDCLLDCEAAEHMACDLAMTTKGYELLSRSREFLRLVGQSRKLR